MKIPHFAFAVIVCLLVGWMGSQSQILFPQKISGAINLDSLTMHVRILSGDTTFQMDGDTLRIANRTDTTYRTLARRYIVSKLQSYGLQVTIDTLVFNQGYTTGANVIATQSGGTEPAVAVIIGAHYDARRSGGASPGADDDASGCAAVLETARLLSGVVTDRTIVYAFWDLQNWGRLGSYRHASQIAARGDSVFGVVDVEMIGWDGNDNHVGEVHVRNYGHSEELGDSLLALSQRASTGATLVLYDPGLTNGDHLSFWEKGITALLLCEEVQGGDQNPFWHTENDLIEHFNFSTFQGLATLATESVVSMSHSSDPLLVRNLSPEFPGECRLLQNFPNPFNPITTIRYGLPHRSHVLLTIFNTIGQRVAELENGDMDAGFHEVQFNGRNLASGVYFYRLSTGSFVDTKRLILLK
ncbi:MAG: M28 family peptidase [Bacteroidota bacterium]